MRKIALLFIVIGLYLGACQTTATSTREFSHTSYTPSAVLATPVSVISPLSPVSPLARVTPPPTATATPLPTATPNPYALFLEQFLSLTPTPTPTTPPTSVPWSVADIESGANIERDEAIAELLAKIEIRTVTEKDISPPPIFQRDAPIEQTYIQSATDLMNLSQGDETAYRNYIAAWSPGLSAENLTYIWIYAYDIDQDGAEEWLVSMPALCEASRGSRPAGRAKLWQSSSECLKCWPDSGMCRRLVLLFEREGDLFKPVYIFWSSTELVQKEFWFNAPTLLFIEDLNHNQSVEIVFQTEWVGASTPSLQIYIWEKTNPGWQLSGWLEESSAIVRFEDWNNDGLKDVITYGGTTGSGAVLIQRKYTRVYGWVENLYQLIAEIPDPDPNPYFRIIDADTALRNGKWETGREISQAVLDDFKATPCNQLSSSRNLIAYAGIQNMLSVLLIDEEIVDIPNLLNKMNNECGFTDNPFIGGAEVLKMAYQQTDDVKLSCYAMEAYISTQKNSQNAHLVPAMAFDMANSFSQWEAVSQLCPL